jgi:hypothetical protein
MDAKPWTEEQFRRFRPHLAGFVQSQVRPLIENPACNRIIIHAPVKSGKREIMEYIAVHDTSTTERLHVAISAWYRKSDDVQRSEIEQHNLHVFTITSVRSTEACMDWLTQQLDTEQRELVIHLDECDYGSGNIQALSEIWKIVRKHEFVTCILYSATPEEVMCSTEVTECDAIEDLMSGVSVIYTPPQGYCGSERFLQEGLVHEADEFFSLTDYVLSEQGRDILSDMRKQMETNPRRNIMVLRLSYSELNGKLDRKENKAFYKFIHHIPLFPELKKTGDTPSTEQFVILVDKEDKSLKGAFTTERVEWSNKDYWDSKGTERPILIVIDQTSSRSTEWDCHDRVYATHDFRRQIRYNTVSQAQERVNHYSQKYGGFQPIHVYGSVDVFLLSANKIDYTTFYNPLKWKLKRIQQDPPAYLVVSGQGTELHPQCPPEGFNRDQARDIIKMMFKKRSLSVRIHGSTKIVPVYKAVWKKMSPDKWDTEWPLIKEDPTNGLRSEEWNHTHNPFTTASLHRLPNGEWCGNYRGWRKLIWKNGSLYTRIHGTFQAIPLVFSDKKTKKKICYHQGELGVLFLYVDGEERKNTLQPSNSMYGISI